MNRSPQFLKTREFSDHAGERFKLAAAAICVWATTQVVAEDTNRDTNRFLLQIVPDKGLQSALRLSTRDNTGHYVGRCHVLYRLASLRHVRRPMRMSISRPGHTSSRSLKKIAPDHSGGSGGLRGRGRSRPCRCGRGGERGSRRSRPIRWHRRAREISVSCG